jgi:pimeloyl-ACP methyl ester carboxylesterase
VITSHDGLPLATEVRGDRPDLLLIHANGFCKETWHPLLEELDGTRAVALDQRGHGDSGTPEHPFDWWDLGRDVLTVLEGVETGSELIGVGHSSGGAAVGMAEILQPGTFDRLILAEPIIPPPPFERWEDHPLAILTERRRASFESPLGAFESYRDRPPSLLGMGALSELFSITDSSHAMIDGL